MTIVIISSSNISIISITDVVVWVIVDEKMK